MTDETLILDIHNAMHAARRSQDLSPVEQAAAHVEDKRAHREAMAAFVELNEWRETGAFYDLGHLGRNMGGRMVMWADGRDSDLLDHPAWFRRDRRYAAVVGQPYLSDVDIAETRARLARRDLTLHLPPDPLASFHYPGWTLFVVVAKPGVEVRFLPEQDGRLKGLWRDWLSASSDYRASAMAALLEATL
jgi:hypothetical protein